jgi:hypothetical protein
MEGSVERYVEGGKGVWRARERREVGERGREREWRWV